VAVPDQLVPQVLQGDGRDAVGGGCVKESPAKREISFTVYAWLLVVGFCRLYAS
jgi:hypothetical protein